MEKLRDYSAKNSEDRRLVSVQVNKVLGEYDHEFKLEKSGEFVILYGPNGVGKTRVLEILISVCRMNITRLLASPFSSAELLFSDNSKLCVTRQLRPNPEGQLEFEGLPSASNDQTELEITLYRNGLEAATSRVSELNDFQTFLHNNTPYQPLDDAGNWVDPEDGEVISYDMLRGIYLPRFRGAKRRNEFGQEQVSKVANEIREFCDSLDARLIETQRLISTDTRAHARARGNFRFKDDAEQNKPTIVRFSDKIKSELDKNLSENSRLTQSLDSTFPRRMLEQGEKSASTEIQLRNKWSEQNKRRARLTQIADLNVGPELALPKEELNTWQLGMLELYLSDADDKLNSFSDILKRIDLLEEIVNARLLRKFLQVNANDGLVVTRYLDKSKVKLEDLSSGEQHEIILIFDLLFNVRPGSIVMIDEPEISLHIGWQRKFISDVLRISKLVGFQFVVATHSPQIIDKWWAYATRLGPDRAGFLEGEEVQDDA